MEEVHAQGPCQAKVILVPTASRFLVTWCLKTESPNRVRMRVFCCAFAWCGALISIPSFLGHMVLKRGALEAAVTDTGSANWRDPFNQDFRKFRSKTQWICSVQPETFRKNGSTFWGGPLFPVGQVVACEQALLFGRVKRVSRERAFSRGSLRLPK